MRLSGKDMDFMLGGLRLIAEEVTLTIDDKRAPVMDKGVPNGFVDGDVSASGEITVDTKNFNLVIEAAKAKGSFKQLDPFDSVFNGETASEQLNIEAFGCLLRISDLLNPTSSGGEKLKHKLPFDVTSTDFVRINGVPYLSDLEVEGLN